MPERELGDGAADAPLDALGPERDLVIAVALPPFAGAVGVTHRHPDDGDRSVDAADRGHPGNPPAGAYDHVPADLLPEDAIWAADVVGSLRRDRRRLEAEARLDDGARGLVDDLILRPASRLQRQVEVRELELEADDLGGENPQGLREQLLAGLVAFEDGDRPRVHDVQSTAEPVLRVPRPDAGVRATPAGTSVEDDRSEWRNPCDRYTSTR